MKNFFLKSNNRKDFSSKIGVSAGTIKNKAEAVKELLNIKEVEASFVLARKDDRVFISARSLGNINVHVLMENLGGGGHRDMAGAQLDTSLEKAYEMVKDTIQTYIKEEE